MSYYNWIINREIRVCIRSKLTPDSCQKTLSSVVEVGDSVETTARYLLKKELKSFQGSHLSEPIYEMIGDKEITIFDYMI